MHHADKRDAALLMTAPQFHHVEKYFEKSLKKRLTRLR